MVARSASEAEPRALVEAPAGPVLLFDGVCNVCNAVVQIVLKHERAPEMKFASLQSDVGRALLTAHGLSLDVDTVVLLVDGKAFVRSAAAVRVLWRLKGLYRLLAPPLWIVPGPVRDLGYNLFARVRYRVFGRRDACMVPTPEMRSRFL